MTEAQSWRAPRRWLERQVEGQTVGEPEEWIERFQQWCDLPPQGRVLEVGCGAGRIAIPLATYLTKEGRYDGLDIVPDRVEWCKENITSRAPNFRFQLADILNKASNPTGTMSAKDYVFPFPDEEFDLVYLISVFTHMLQEDVEHYVAEIARVLKTGGRCLATFLLLNEESNWLLSEGKSKWHLPYDFGEYRAESEKVPEHLVAYNEAFVLDLYERCGLQVTPPIHYGRWSGRSSAEGLSGPEGNQDFIVAEREQAPRT
jgi:SAM-dependent methyltransferase